MSFADFEETPNGNNFQDGEEVDPAADFLARQEGEMAGLEDNMATTTLDDGHTNGNGTYGDETEPIPENNGASSVINL